MVMKKHFSFLIMALLLLSGCSEDKSSANTEEKIFIFNEGTYLTPSVGSESCVLTFGFKSNTSWNVLEDKEWIEVTPASGDATTASFDVKISKNESGRIRKATVIVAYSTKQIAIDITQKAELCAVNEIAYRTTDESLIAISSTDGFGSKFVENIYENGYGKLRFEGKVTTIPANAFKECTTLTTIILPKELTSVGKSAFEGCTLLENVTLDAKLTSIGERAFYLCSALKSIALPQGITSLGGYTFYNCASLTEVTLAEGIKSIGSHCFALCSALTSVALPNSATTVSEYAFTDCSSLTSVAFGSGIQSLGDNAFASCSALDSITLPEGLKSLGKYVFSNCTKVTTVTLPATTEQIGDFALFNCSALKSVECLATTVPALGRYALHKYSFANTGSSGEAGKVEELSYTPIVCSIYVPAEAVESYKAADNWSDYASYIKTK